MPEPIYVLREDDLVELPSELVVITEEAARTLLAVVMGDSFTAEEIDGAVNELTEALNDLGPEEDA